MTLRELFADIADAIREKDGSTGEIVASTFPVRIRAIQVGSGDIYVQVLRITSPPNKVAYEYNGFRRETFDSTGMTFEIDLKAFATTVTAPIPLENVAMAPTGPLEPDVEQIVCSFKFGGITVKAFQPITVTFAGPTWADLESINPTWQTLEGMFASWSELENYGNLTSA